MTIQEFKKAMQSVAKMKRPSFQGVATRADMVTVKDFYSPFNSVAFTPLTSGTYKEALEILGKTPSFEGKVALHNLLCLNAVNSGEARATKADAFGCNWMRFEDSGQNIRYSYM